MDGRGLRMSMLCLSLIAAMLVVSIVPSAEGEDSAELEASESDVHHLHGYVYDVPAQEERRLIAGVTVKTWSSTEMEYQTTATNYNGEFTVEYNENVKFISFSLDGYTMKGWCSELLSNGDTDLYTIKLKDYSQVQGVHELYDNAGYTAIISRTNSYVHGTVSTMIDNVVVPIADASVTLASSRLTITERTDSQGNFSIGCDGGSTYSLTISANGFYDVTLDKVTPEEKPLTFYLEQKNHEIIFGMDIAHVLAMFGLIVTMIVAVIAVYLIRRPEKENGLYVVNDIPPAKKKKK
jgi:hypothetical protein